MVRKNFHDNFIKVQKLGKGANGIVASCKYIPNMSLVAAKGLGKKQNNCPPEIVELSFKKEVSVHKSVDHPSFPTFYGVYESENSRYIVMELLKESLSNYIQRRATICKMTVIKIMRKLLEAVAYLHKNDIMHRDIKPDNIMLRNFSDGNIDPVLIDFGFAEQS